MVKFAKFNRTDLTPIQIQERARRKRGRIKMLGKPAPLGTPPRRFTAAGEPVFKPTGSEPATAADFGRLTAGLPRLMRRPRPQFKKRQK